MIMYNNTVEPLQHKSKLVVVLKCQLNLLNFHEVDVRHFETTTKFGKVPLYIFLYSLARMNICIGSINVMR